MLRWYATATSVGLTAASTTVDALDLARCIVSVHGSCHYTTFTQDIQSSTNRDLIAVRCLGLGIFVELDPDLRLSLVFRFADLLTFTGNLTRKCAALNHFYPQSSTVGLGIGTLIL